ncbi:MAG: DUF1385 domain-containing protein [Actinobacteria bacterium HGW-Actinobacteria-7]|jgi:uncharacterized protein YqhQ|nr:MAG: DUF1385 domain-containing protein [Actinobacteria bacterium HGW-Actinobacteria-7]
MSDSVVERLDGPITHTHIGGQAVLEGIMMRGKYNWAIAVRTPDGSIHSEAHDLRSAAKKHAWMRKPIIRGVVALVETLTLAMRAFSISASMSGESEDEQLSSKEIGLSLVFGLALAIGLFIVLPAVLTNLMVSAKDHPFAWNIVDGVLRVGAFFLYIWAISRMGEIQRVFAYHGAEHKTIHAYEHSLPLEVPVIQQFTTKHMRCGTSFLLMVMVIAILVFSLVPVKPIAALLGWESRLGVLAILIVSRLILMPLVAGLAYEVTVKWAGNHSDNPIVKIVLWPGLQMQAMTTREPDDDMVEVAVVATQLVIDRELAEEAGERGEPIAMLEAEDSEGVPTTEAVV